jgi:hypothetical protein
MVQCCDHPSASGTPAATTVSMPTINCSPISLTAAIVPDSSSRGRGTVRLLQAAGLSGRSGNCAAGRVPCRSDRATGPVAIITLCG